MASAHVRSVADGLGSAVKAVPVYEKRLDLETRWALAEGSRFFEERSAVQDTLRNIVHRLNEIGVPYVVCGGLALFAHGFRRFTEVVDLLVTEEGLQRIHKEPEGLGYIPPFKGSKLGPDGRVYGIELLNANEQLAGERVKKPVVENQRSGKSSELRLAI